MFSLSLSPSTLSPSSLSLSLTLSLLSLPLPPLSLSLSLLSLSLAPLSLLSLLSLSLPPPSLSACGYRRCSQMLPAAPISLSQPPAGKDRLNCHGASQRRCREEKRLPIRPGYRRCRSHRCITVRMSPRSSSELSGGLRSRHGYDSESNHESNQNKMVFD